VRKKEEKNQKVRKKEEKSQKVMIKVKNQKVKKKEEKNQKVRKKEVKNQKKENLLILISMRLFKNSSQNSLLVYLNMIRRMKL